MPATTTTTKQNKHRTDNTAAQTSVRLSFSKDISVRRGVKGNVSSVCMRQQNCMCVVSFCMCLVKSC